MAKNTPYNPTADRAEQIRKAKGNPNKNLHAKKSGSNYGGYKSAEKEAAERAERAHENARRNTDRIPAPMWMNVTLGILLVLMIASLVLRTGVLLNSIWFAHLTEVVMGSTCCYLFYYRRITTVNKDTMLFKIVQGILLVCGLFYGLLGAWNLFQLIP